MKTKLFRTLALTLCISLLLSTGAFAAFPTDQLLHFSTVLGTGVTLSSNTFWKDSVSDKVAENYITYTPNQLVTPVVVYGSKVCNYGNFEDMAKLLESRGYSVIAGINADYYNTADFQPLGIVITDGKLKSSDDGHYAIGFNQDGSAIIGSPALNMSFAVGGNTYPISGINKVRTSSGFYFFTEDFSYTTKSPDSGTDIVMSLVSGNLTVNSTLTLTVDSIAKSSGATELQPGKYVLSLSDSAAGQDILKQFAVGKTVTVRVSCADTRWNKVQFAAGSLYKLVTKGSIENGLETSPSAPRTAVGIKADGTVIFYTADGRQAGYSAGASIAEIAERMLALGCTEAGLMDGGGSTTIGAKFIGDTGYTLINSPSDGRMRNITEFIMLAAKGSGGVAELGVYPYDAVMLTGTQKTFTYGAADNFGNPKPVSGVTWGIKSGGGQISENGVYTAGGSGETVIVAANDRLSATATVLVVGTPDTLTVRNESTKSAVSTLTLEAGQSLALTAEAVYKRTVLETKDTDFGWSFTGDACTVDSGGTLKAGLKAGSGTLTVKAGTKSIDIPVTVKINIACLEDFEGAQLKLSGTVQNAAARLSTDIEHVRFGRQSAEIAYDLTSGDAVIPISLSNKAAFVSVWVYGDGSGNTVQLMTPGGRTKGEILSFTGWKQLTFSAGSDITGIVVSGRGSGTIWVDRIMAASTPVSDTEAPVISVPVVTKTSVTCEIQDSFDGSVSASNVTVTCDGNTLAFTFENGLIKATLPVIDEKTEHRVTVYAADVSGNRARQSTDLPASIENSTVFCDTDGHWAETYIDYLYSKGIINGLQTDAGLSFLPGDNMTREQFAVVMSRYLGVDVTKYAQTELNFTDTDKIAEYALPAVRAMYALGVIKGVAVGDTVCFNPKDPMTRAQAMTSIGRTIPAGYVTKHLNFSDSDTIPAWAAGYVDVLTSLGTVGGREDGTIRPNMSITRAEVAKIITLMY